MPPKLSPVICGSSLPLKHWSIFLSRCPARKEVDQSRSFLLCLSLLCRCFLGGRLLGWCAPLCWRLCRRFLRRSGLLRRSLCLCCRLSWSFSCCLGWLLSCFLSCFLCRSFLSRRSSSHVFSPSCSRSNRFER